MYSHQVPQQQQQHHQQQQQQQQPQSQQMMRATGNPPAMGMESTHQQQKFLTEASSKVQEHAYYMKQAMDQHNLPLVLDRAAHMVGELGGPPHGQHHHHNNSNNNQQSSASASFQSQANTGHAAKLTPKNYYELYMRALQDMPMFEEYLYNLASKPNPQQQQQQSPFPPDTIRIVETVQHLNTISSGARDNAPQYTMRQLYDCVQYCPRVVSRLYLQIAAGSALIKSGECGAKFVMRDLQNAVKCEQNPVRGLFLRHYLLTALRDKLPDKQPEHPPNVPTSSKQEQEQPDQQKEEKDDDDDSAEGYLEQRNKVIAEDEKGTVRDSIDFILANFMEMNKLWVRIQHLPGEGNNKDVRKRRERERNDLRILVGTNLVRLSQLECVTSKMYGEIILSPILEHIVTAGDPLSQAYLMDCLVQVFPDEYHIETLPILLNVCPRLRDKVNIRTILQGLMDRLANYLADEELLDETDTNEVKKALARDAFGLFEECIQKVYNARGPKLTSKEVIRLQTALLQFSIRLYPGNMEQVQRCIGECVKALHQANASYDDVPDGTIASNVPNRIKPLDDASVVELEKLLSIPLESLALKVLEFEQYSQLIGFLPWAHRREVSVKMLKAVDNVGTAPQSVKEIEQLFAVIEPLVRDQNIPNNGQPQLSVMPSSTFLSQQNSIARTSTLMAGLGVSDISTGPLPMQSISLNEQTYQHPAQIQKIQQENALVSKLVHLLDHDNADTLFEMLQVARNHISQPGSWRQRVGQTLVAVVFSALRLARRFFDAEQREVKETETTSSDRDNKAGEIGNEKESETKEDGSKNDSSGAEIHYVPVLKGEPESDANLSDKTTKYVFFRHLTFMHPFTLTFFF
jgi:vacuolar protein sorting-associated protein 35